MHAPKSSIISWNFFTLSPKEERLLRLSSMMKDSCNFYNILHIIIFYYHIYSDGNQMCDGLVYPLAKSGKNFKTPLAWLQWLCVGRGFIWSKFYGTGTWIFNFTWVSKFSRNVGFFVSQKVLNSWLSTCWTFLDFQKRRKLFYI